MILRRMTEWPEWGLRGPFSELERLRRELDWLTEGPRRFLESEPSAGVYPLINVTEDKDNYYVRAELPGIKAKDLDISVTGNNLSISGERKITEEDKNAVYHRREREAGTFNRMISLPLNIEAGKVEARNANGILTVILPKVEAEKPRQITIK